MPKGHAILVGLKSVDPNHHGGWDGTGGCWGAEADVDRMHGILEPLGYEITQLKTREATRDRVLGSLEQAAQKLGEGDILVFYFSGHGGQQPDRNGDEMDGHDETLVAYDGDLIDDQLNEAWLRFREGVRIMTMCDSCNSGTVYRGGRDLRIESPVLPIADKSVSRRMKAGLIHMGGCRDGFSSVGLGDGSLFTKAVFRAWNAGGFQGDLPEYFVEVKRCVHDIYQELRAQDVVPQQPQYREYGRVSDSFRGATPFKI